MPSARGERVCGGVEAEGHDVPKRIERLATDGARPKGGAAAVVAGQQRCRREPSQDAR